MLRNSLLPIFLAMLLAGGYVLLTAPDEAPGPIIPPPAHQAQFPIPTAFRIYEIDDLVEDQMAISRLLNPASDQDPRAAAERKVRELATQTLRDAVFVNGIQIFAHRLRVIATPADHDRLSRTFAMMRRSR
jgi:hypothetical protein